MFAPTCTTVASMALIDEDTGLDEHGESPFPGARRPDRAYDLVANGLRIATYEWGHADAPPLLMMHGGFDFARTFDGFAPRLADAGWRVVAWDQRGHGSSEHAALYSWEGDLRDALAVFDHVAPGQAVPVVGHSKGGALMTQLADAQPHRFRCLVNMDGIPYKRNIPDLAEHERTTMLAKDLAGWLDHRRRTAGASRKPGTLDDLAQRRGRMNPRLPHEWLRRLVTTGGFLSEDGWRWRIDPALRFGGFGPWRPEWTLMRLPGLPMPFLGVLGAQMEEMGWGTPPHKVAPYMPMDGRCEVLDDVGHFVHIEQPDHVSSLVLDFIDSTTSHRSVLQRSVSHRSPTTQAADDHSLAGAAISHRSPATQAEGDRSLAGAPSLAFPDGSDNGPDSAGENVVRLRHNKIDVALHLLRREPLDPSVPSRPLLLLHALGDRSPDDVPHWAAAWPGPIAALDFTGHGDSTVPASGGYSPENLMADADHALAYLTNDDPDRSITVLGRGLGAYVALQIAGARASQVHGAILTDGPGLAGGPTGPSSQSFFAVPTDGSAPDPYALIELSRDLRPADYAMSFVSLATAGSPVASPIAVASSFRPAWLDDVARAPGVADTSVAEALDAYS